MVPGIILGKGARGELRANNPPNGSAMGKRRFKGSGRILENFLLTEFITLEDGSGKPCGVVLATPLSARAWWESVRDKFINSFIRSPAKRPEIEAFLELDEWHLGEHATPRENAWRRVLATLLNLPHNTMELKWSAKTRRELLVEESARDFRSGDEWVRFVSELRRLSDLWDAQQKKMRNIVYNLVRSGVGGHIGEPSEALLDRLVAQVDVLRRAAVDATESEEALQEEIGTALLEIAELKASIASMEADPDGAHMDCALTWEQLDRLQGVFGQDRINADPRYILCHTASQAEVYPAVLNLLAGHLSGWTYEQWVENRPITFHGDGWHHLSRKWSELQVGNVSQYVRPGFEQLRALSSVEGTNVAVLNGDVWSISFMTGSTTGRINLADMDRRGFQWCQPHSSSK